MRKSSKRIKGIVAVLLISGSILFFGGCVSPTKTSYTGQDLIKQAEIEREALVAAAQERKSDLDKMYRNGLYFEDFSKEIEILDTFIAQKVEAEYQEVISPASSILIDPHNQYYNASLKQMKEGKLTPEDFYNNPGEHIRKMMYDQYQLIAGVDAEDHTSQYLALDAKRTSILEEYVAKKLGYIKLRIYPLMNKALTREKALELLKERLLKEHIWDNGLIYSSMETPYIINGKSTSGVMIGSRTLDTLQRLKDKYHEEFLPVESIGGTQKTGERYASKRYPEVLFENGSWSTEDAYLQALSQKLLCDEVYRIIKEEGGEKFIAPLSVPVSNDDFIGKNTYNTVEIPDVKDFLLNAYTGEYQVTLNYLKTSDEEIDYALLQRITNRIHILISSEEKSRNVVLVYFYDVDESDKTIVTDLFKRDMLTASDFDDRESLMGIYSNMYRDRVETDGHHYLDVYAEKLEYLLRPSEIFAGTVEEYVKKNTIDSLY